MRFDSIQLFGVAFSGFGLSKIVIVSRLPDYLDKCDNKTGCHNTQEKQAALLPGHLGNLALPQPA